MILLSPCAAALILAAESSVHAQTLSLFGGRTPQIGVASDGNAVTLGVKFYSTQAGSISGIRFYRAAPNISGYRVNLFSISGSLLAQASSTADTCTIPCWEQINFPAPVHIATNTSYIAAYYTSNGRYPDDTNGLAAGKKSNSLIAPASANVGGNGVYTYSSGFPNQSWQASNYWVDVAFTPSAPSLLMSFNPPTPKIPADAPAGTVVSTVNVTWSDGSPFTGSIAFGPPSGNDGGKFAFSGHDIVVNATGPGIGADGGSVQKVTVQAQQ